MTTYQDFTIETDPTALDFLIGFTGTGEGSERRITYAAFADFFVTNFGAGAAYLGDWNASTNTPTVIDNVGGGGTWYRVSVAGTIDLGSGSEAYDAGDMIVLSSITRTWDRIGRGAAIVSVAGKTGVVVLDMDDLTETSGGKILTASERTNIGSGVTHAADGTIHFTVASIDHTLITNKGTNTHAQIDTHIGDTTNPHVVTATQLSLGNVDNTSDANKPVSTATQTALNLKVTSVAGKTGVVTLNMADLSETASGKILTSTERAQITDGVVHRADTVNPHAVTKAQVSLSNADNTSDANKPISTLTQAALNLKEDAANKNVNNGYAPLDAAALVPLANLPASVKGDSDYNGAWNASTNSPTLIDGTGNNGDTYRISVAGTRDLGSGSVIYEIGDSLIYNGSTTVWDRFGRADVIQSVAGKTGIVTLDMSDLSETAAGKILTSTERTQITDGVVHRADATIHFIESSIDHTAITNIGTNSHASIDSALTTTAAHISDAAIHFTESSIDHGSISGLADDDHVIYIKADGTRAFAGNVTVNSTASVGLSVSRIADVASIGINSTTGKDWRLQSKADSTFELVDGSTATTAMIIDSSHNISFPAGNLAVSSNQISCSTSGVGISSNLLGKLQVTTADSGAFAGNGVVATADEFVIENSTHAGMTIFSGPTSVGEICFGDSADADVGRIRYDHNTDFMSITTDGATALTIDDSQNVGIGIASNLLGKLQVNKTGSISSIDANADEIVVEDSGTAGANAGISILSGNTGSGTISFGDTDVQNKGRIVYSHSGDSFSFVVNAAEAMKIDNSQNVGIGESNPLGRLHVKTGESGGTVDSNANEFVVESATGGGITILTGGASLHGGHINFGDIDDNNVGQIRYDHSDNSMDFTTSAVVRFRIKTNGVLNSSGMPTSAGGLSSGDLWADSGTIKIVA